MLVLVPVAPVLLRQIPGGDQHSDGPGHARSPRNEPLFFQVDYHVREVYPVAAVAAVGREKYLLRHSGSLAENGGIFNGCPAGWRTPRPVRCAISRRDCAPAACTAPPGNARTRTARSAKARVLAADVSQTDPISLANIRRMLGLFSPTIAFRSGPCGDAGAEGTTSGLRHGNDPHHAENRRFRHAFGAATESSAQPVLRCTPRQTSHQALSRPSERR